MILQTVGCVLIVMCIRLALSLPLVPFERFHINIKKIRKWLQKDLIINGFLELMISTYLDFLIAAYLSLSFGVFSWNFKPYRNFYGEVLSLTITCFTLVVGVLFIPVCSFAIIF